MINKLKIILYALSGLYIIVSPFYFKLIVVRLPKELMMLNNSVCLIFFLFFCSLFIKSLYDLLKQSGEKSSTIIEECKKNIILPLQNIINDSLSLIDDYIKHDLLGKKYLGYNLLKFNLFLNKKLTQQNSIIIFLLLDVFPKIILLVSFIIDIYILEKLTYVYFFGSFSLIPLIFRYVLFTLKEFSASNIKGLSENHILFTNKNYDEIPFKNILENIETNFFNEKQMMEKISYITLREDSDNIDEDLSFYMDQFYVFQRLYTNIDFFYQLKQQKKYKMFLISHYFFHSVLWFYLLFFKYI